jgi:hypothetical protein
MSLILMVKLAICTSLDPVSCCVRANDARSSASARLFVSPRDKLVSLRYLFTKSGLISPDLFKSNEWRLDRTSVSPADAANVFVHANNDVLAAVGKTPLANSLLIKLLTLSKLLTHAPDRTAATRLNKPTLIIIRTQIYWLEFGERFLPRPTTTLTKRRLYLMRWNARPFGCFFFSCLATFGV